MHSSSLLLLVELQMLASSVEKAHSSKTQIVSKPSGRCTAQADLHRTQPPSVAVNTCNRVSKQLDGLNLRFTGGVFRDTEALLCELRDRDISCDFSSACVSEAL